MNTSESLFQHSPLPMWVYDAKTLNFLSVNEEALRKYGYSEHEFLAMSINDLRLQEDLNAGKPEEELFIDGIYTLVRKNKTTFSVRIQSSSLAYNGVNAILVIATDVTDRIEDDVKMRLSNERYNIISKATSDTIWDWNLETNTVIWNKGIKGIFGYKNLVDNTTTSEWWVKHIHPDDRDRVCNNIHQHIQDKISRWQDEYRFMCADGTYKHVFDRGFMVFDDRGESTRMIGSLQDISLRKQEEQWSRLLESVVINATDAVQICTGNIEGSGQSIIYVNEAFTRMSGYTKFELIGASPRISQGPETDINEIRRLKDAIESKLPCEIEVINYTKQGKEYWVSQSNAPIADASGEITHWISIQRDITLNRKHLQEIENQNKKFREIAWIQSHLVRAPLARIMGLVDLLQSFVPGDDKDELLLHLSNSAKELDAIIINIADKTPASKI